jgi:hypothetical protein
VAKAAEDLGARSLVVMGDAWHTTNSLNKIIYRRYYTKDSSPPALMTAEPES